LAGMNLMLLETFRSVSRNIEKFERAAYSKTFRSVSKNIEKFFDLVAYITVETTLFEETSTTKLYNCFIIQSSHSFHMHNQI
jgi:hypothetical protein